MNSEWHRGIVPMRQGGKAAMLHNATLAVCQRAFVLTWHA